jgi:hypothetical protein
MPGIRLVTEAISLPGWDAIAEATGGATTVTARASDALAHAARATIEAAVAALIARARARPGRSPEGRRSPVFVDSTQNARSGGDPDI